MCGPVKPHIHLFIYFPSAAHINGRPARRMAPMVSHLLNWAQRVWKVAADDQHVGRRMFPHSSSYLTYHNKAHHRPDPVAPRLRVFDSVLPMPLRGRSCSSFASTPQCLSEDRQPLPPPATPPSPTLCVSVAPWLMSQCFTNGRSTLPFPSPLFLLTKSCIDESWLAR